jgi:class 3 adenylate cyclase
MMKIETRSGENSPILRNMAAFISRKTAFLTTLAGLAAAAGMAVLLCYVLAGPRLGPWYDFLLNRRSPPPAAREILLIDTGDLIEPGDALPLLMTLTEMDAGGLVIQVPVLGLSPGRSESETEIRRRFDDEFNLLGRNIRNLFEAIRVGSVPPVESARYVENLVELAERGKERLSSTLVHRDEEGALRFEQAAVAFGRVWKAGDLRTPEGLASLPMDSPWYSKPRTDPDGKFRRISPVLRPVVSGDSETENAAEIEHVVYAGLSSRRESFPEHPNGNSGPLYSAGEILLEKIPGGEGFRRLSLARFREYDETGRNLAEALKAAEALGLYSNIAPERSPVALGEYARALREDLLESPGPEKKAAWIYSRAEYFAGLEELLYGPSEMALVGGYEELMATEKLNDEGLARLTELRDELIRAFAGLREQHGTLVELRMSLEETLASSFCILGPPAETEASAALANTLLTGHFIIPGSPPYILFWSLSAALLLIVIIFTMSPWRALGTGFFLTFLTAAGFSWSFIISGYWIDPLIPSAAAFTGTLTIFSLSLMIIRRGARRFRLAYGPYISKSSLKQLVREGRPQPSEVLCARAAIVAIRNGELPALEDRGDPRAAVQSAGVFRGKAAELFTRAGAVIIGMDGDLVLAAFGSPLERIVLEGLKAGPRYRDDPLDGNAPNPALRAAGFVTELVTGNQETASWRFGIDTGECAFFWSGLPGYSACGRPVVRARILSSLAPRYKVKVIITELVNEGLRNIPARKLNVLASRDRKEYFYELLYKRA